MELHLSSLCTCQVHEDGARYHPPIDCICHTLRMYVRVYGVDGGQEFLHLGIANTLASNAMRIRRVFGI